ncbi:protein eva-1 homolog C isoform X1 [Alosa alosa]|uniref:protein eva-1 homolog C isoform X1 n=1 Tax=Alosa alosa TaxID=278164 RepID=UPI002015560D|nr:protein eva-1 homolog C isoform X1 [Alosa alosa]
MGTTRPPWGFSRSPRVLASCVLLALGALTHTAQAAPDFTVYLHKILRNHTAHACDGDTLEIRCPSKTTIAILSAFYGRRVPSQYLCPTTNPNVTLEENTECMSPVAVQKVTSECQEQRSCHIPVISQVFGQDPCPETSKYMLVSYKCRPEHHRTKMVCENERLRLACKNDTVLAIYSATFGHQLHWNHDCPQENDVKADMECFSSTALRRVSRRCHGKANCSVLADIQNFGDPCFPGTRKHLRVSYTCGVPETVALYFVSGICAGLVFLLCLFGLKSTLVRDAKELFTELGDEIKATRRRGNSNFEDDDISDASFRRLTQSYRMADMFGPDMIMTVEMVERGDERGKELTNGDMWPHRDSSPYAIHNIKSSST